MPWNTISMKSFFNFPRLCEAWLLHSYAICLTLTTQCCAFLRVEAVEPDADSCSNALVWNMCRSVGWQHSALCPVAALPCTPHLHRFELEMTEEIRPWKCIWKTWREARIIRQCVWMKGDDSHPPDRRQIVTKEAAEADKSFWFWQQIKCWKGKWKLSHRPLVSHLLISTASATLLCGNLSLFLSHYMHSQTWWWWSDCLWNPVPYCTKAQS